ncbi:uncharacterized protein LOC126696423 [Quercus robur]|uniref:uncharacterized protein LOC126696423 n=1 Tax=Quercus robur TaxID=38942 RepID=UPI002161201D|nr:uncharacterized protein LOC126696423 [Quercus robur]
MEEGETLKTYSNRYWEMFNEIDGDFEDVAIRTFKVGLPAEHELRKSLTKKPAQNMCQLMDQIDEHKRVEDNQQQGKGKAKVIPLDRRDFRFERYNNNRPRRDFSGHAGLPAAQVVSTIFKEPVHQILEKIKVESYFKWPNKIGGLVKVEKLGQFLHQPLGQGNHIETVYRRESSLRPPLGTTSVILAVLGQIEACSHGPHDDTLVVTLHIEGYDVRRVLVDQGSSAEIMYPDMYKRLNLKPENLVSYDSPLVGFDRKTVIPKGLIKLPVQARSEVVDANFIVVDAYLPYIAILARPWLHTMGAVSSSLHLKVKYPFGDHVEELVGSQAMAR